MKEKGRVKMTKSKVEPVSKWRCPRQTAETAFGQSILGPNLCFSGFRICDPEVGVPRGGRPNPEK